MPRAPGQRQLRGRRTHIKRKRHAINGSRGVEAQGCIRCISSRLNVDDLKLSISLCKAHKDKAK